MAKKVKLFQTGAVTGGASDSSPENSLSYIGSNAHPSLCQFAVVVLTFLAILTTYSFPYWYVLHTTGSGKV